MPRWSSERRPPSKIPLGPPLEKGEDNRLSVGNPILSPPFIKGGWGDFFYGHGFLLSTGIVIFIAPYGAPPFRVGLWTKADPASEGMLYCLC